MSIEKNGQETTREKGSRFMMIHQFEMTALNLYYNKIKSYGPIMEGVKS